MTAGRLWCGFIYFDPRLPETQRIFIRRVDRDEGIVGELEAQVGLFLHELDQRLLTLSRVTGHLAEAA